MGWFDKSPEKKAEECEECQEVLEEYYEHHVPLHVCDRCGHLYLAVCSCDLKYPPSGPT
jgi:hypothetical protein